MKIFKIIFSIFTPLLYIFLITPGLIFFKFFKKKPIHLKFDKTTNTYWLKKDNKKSGSGYYFFKQF